MYYPESMTKEDIVAFEHDMAALTLREEEEIANWILQEAGEAAREGELMMEFYSEFHFSQFAD